jgi:hypothetical protein
VHLSDAVIQATAARQRMLQQILTALARDPGGALAAYQLEDLAAVLQHEDHVRQVSYRAEEAGGIALARDRVAWSVLKSRIAHKGFGASIVPEWEEQRDEIDRELRAALDVLYAEYRALGGEDVQRAVLFLQLEHGLLGFYPDWPQTEWAAQLSRLEPQRALYIASWAEDRGVHFYLAGREPEASGH